jgi:hypothetical protein
VVSFTPRPLYFQRKSPWYPLDRRLGGLQSRSGYGGEVLHKYVLQRLMSAGGKLYVHNFRTIFLFVREVPYCRSNKNHVACSYSRISQKLFTTLRFVMFLYIFYEEGCDSNKYICNEVKNRSLRKYLLQFIVFI